jgi:hypothetical protein
MKKETTTSAKTKKTTKAVAPAKKATKKVAKTVVEPEVITPVHTATTTPSIPMQTKIVIGVVTVLIVGLAFAYVKFWNIALVNGVAISRIKYYQTMESQIGKQTLSNMVTEALVEDAADKANFVVDQNALNERLAKIEESVKQNGETLEEALVAEGITKDELLRQLRLRLIVETLGAGQAVVTEDQINAYIKENKDMFSKTSSTQEIHDMVKTQLESQAKNTNIQTWLENLKTTATINYR